MDKGRVLSEEEIKAIEGYANYYGGTEESDSLLDAHYRNALRLIATIRDRDKQIAELKSYKGGWDSIKNYFDSDPMVSPLFKETCDDLIKDQCFGIANHMIVTVEKLAERVDNDKDEIEELENELREAKKQIAELRKERDEIDEYLDVVRVVQTGLRKASQGANEQIAELQAFFERRRKLLLRIGDLWRGDWSGSNFDGRDGKKWLYAIAGDDETELARVEQWISELESEEY